MPAPLPVEQDLWIFGYGSLMWRPGFAFVEQRPARLIGAHRSLCVYSHRHRGTPERPGLVLALDRGGSCLGVAFRVDRRNAGETLAYLRGREQVTRVYLEAVRPVILLDTRERVRAVCYVADRTHPQYAGPLPLKEQLRLVGQASGRSGSNRDYLLETVRRMEALGIRDRDLEWLKANL